MDGDKKILLNRRSVRLIAFSGVLLLLSYVYVGRESQHPLIGLPAPDFTLTALDGNTVTLSSYLGNKVILLDFFATWCPPCRRGLPVIDSLAESYQESDDVVVLAVNLNESEELVRRLWKEQGLTMPVLFDRGGGVASSYAVSSIPHIAVIDKRGVIREVHAGFSRSLSKHLKEFLATLSAEAV